MDIEQIREGLRENRSKTVEALLEKKEEITLKDEQGKEIWRTVIEFYQEHGLNRELEIIKERLYEDSAAEIRQIGLEMWADLVGALYKTITFPLFFIGQVCLGTSIIHDIRQGGYERYLRKRL